MERSPDLAGAIEILRLGYYPAVFGTNIGFDGITVALLGQANPIGIMLSALLLGAMRAGAPLMQIQARVPVEIIDVIQGVILIFLAAEIVVRRIFRLRTPTPVLASCKRSPVPMGKRWLADGLPIQYSYPRISFCNSWSTWSM